jgi:hypothetical protein
MSQAVQPTSAAPTVLAQTREFWVSDPLEEALRKMKLTLNRVGQLSAVVPGENIEGNIRFGVQHVSVKIMWVEEDAETRMDAMLHSTKTAVPQMKGTRWLLEATSEDKSGQAQRSALERLEDAYLHFDSPDYAADRLGVLPYTIIGILVVVLLLCLWILRNPLVQKKLPNVPAAYVDKAAPAETTKDQSTDSNSSN